MKKYQNRRQTRMAGTAEREALPQRMGLKLLPYEIRENLPILGSQRSKGGGAKVWAKCCTPDGAYSWYITEGSARRDREDQAVDYLLYGLVEGPHRKLDYFWLSDLAAFHSPAGSPVRRDVRWRPKELREIAPEMFPSPEDHQVGKGRI